MTEFYTPAQFAKLLKVNREYVYDLIKQGRIRAIKFNTRYRIPSTEIDRLVSEAKAQNE